ncbi:membrane-bound lytic murein transglycosylase D [Pseudarcicella hirudinis]|uniref:Membrane-bound lytic murein transglycosylase D n=2 Tax=Pseudarcicella hirudinis TaxID=1079859 RepID=A0A1I5PLU0_9BACT|nr:membrane-bound lytic murein transglycosylase D [Pseudarcicella hirudinis]
MFTKILYFQALYTIKSIYPKSSHPNSLLMRKRFSLSYIFMLFFPFALVKAQELPRSIIVGSVNVRIDGSAKSIIQNEIDNLNNNRKYLDAVLSKMVLYFPVIERILAEEGIPDDFKYLCVQESALNPEAISTSNAYGFWQFKRETAQEVGLRVDGVVDERKHIVAATRGAAVYLSRNNLILRNWVATLLSYRLGLGAVRRNNSLDWAAKNDISVNSSTDWYVLRFLAYKHFLEREYKSFKDSSGSYLFEYPNSRGKNLSDISRELNVDLVEIRKNNSWLQSTSVPDDKDYIVYFPVNSDQIKKLKDRSSQQNTIESQEVVKNDLGFPVLNLVSQSSKKGDAVLYEINGKKGILAFAGDTPETIADRGGINKKKFLKYNDLDENDRIIPNEIYYLRKKDKKAVVAFHTVQGNETLWKISQMYGVQLEELLSKNRLQTIQRLQKGRLIWLVDTRPNNQPVEFVNTNDAPPSAPTILTREIYSRDEKSEFYSRPEQSDLPAKNTDNPSKPNVTTTVIDNTEKVVIEPVQKPAAEPVIPKTTIVETPPKTEEPKVSAPVVTVVEPAEESASTPKSSGNEIRKIINHTVQIKQTFFSIAKMYGMSLDELYRINKTQPGTPLRSGQVILVSQSVGINSDNNIAAFPKQGLTEENSGREIVTKTENPVVNKYISGNNNSSTHVVQAGETLFRVSKIYGVSVDKLMQWNGLNNYTIEIGQELIVKNQNDSGTKDIKTKYHILKTGETVFRVSQLYGVSVEDVVKWNNIRNYNVLAGQKLIIRR